MDDTELALFIAVEAGKALMEVRAAGLTGWDLERAGDEAAQRVIERLFATYRPDDHVLSEEAPDDPSRLGADRVWIVDPCDGTRQFATPPRTDWAVHIALWERKADAATRLTTGVVHLPARGVTHHTGDPAPLRPRTERLRIAASRSRTPALVKAACATLDADLVTMGSAGVKGTAMFRGEADAYAHVGGQFEWDNAAPVAVALAAGLKATRVDGSPLQYNAPDPYLPDFVICHPDDHELILAALARGLTAR